MKTEEKWKPIEGYAGYEVSNQGRVRSYRRNGNGGLRSEPRLMNPGMRGGKNHAYPYVGLYADGIKTKYSVHCLVLNAFGPTQPPNTEASHLDGNPKNVAISNLAWETHKENLDRRAAHGTLRTGEKHWRSKLTYENVSEIRSLWSSGAFTQSAIADRFRITQANVSWIVNNHGWAA